MGYYNYVNTKMGSFNSMRYSNGNCYPVCAVPRGMNFFTLQTNGAGRGWFYSPYDKFTEGIKLTHMPSPWLPDYGSVLVFADCGESDPGLFWSGYEPSLATIDPAYMAVNLHRNSCKMELTPTDASAVLRVSVGEGRQICRVCFKSSKVFSKFSAEKNTLYVKIPIKHPNGKLVLYEYLVVRCEKSAECSSESESVSLSFAESSAVLRLATSFISFEQAELNLEREVGEKSFEEVKKTGEELWERTLSCIKVEDPNEDKLKTFYSCLYRYSLWPRKLYERDKDGNPYHINTETGQTVAGFLYTDNGFWDTYRTVYPLMSILDRDLYAEIAEGFYNYYRKHTNKEHTSQNKQACSGISYYLKSIIKNGITKYCTLWQRTKQII